MNKIAVQVLLGAFAYCSAQIIRLDLSRMPWPVGRPLSCADTIRLAIIPPPGDYSEAEHQKFGSEFNVPAIRNDGIWQEWQERVVPILHPRPFRLDLRTERDSCLDSHFSRGHASLVLSTIHGVPIDSLVFGFPLEYNRMGWIRLGGLDTRRFLSIYSYSGNSKPPPKTPFEHIFPDSGKTPLVLRLVLRRHSVDKKAYAGNDWSDPVHGLSVNAEGLLFFDQERESNWMNRFENLVPGDTAFFLRIDPAAPKLELIEKRAP